MTAPMDPAEAAAFAWAVGRHVHEVRERVLAILTARLVGEYDGEAVARLYGHLERFDETYLREMFIRALWDGGEQAEATARSRLNVLARTRDVGPVLDVINGGPS